MVKKETKKKALSKIKKQKVKELATPVKADHRKQRGRTAPNRALGHVRPRKYKIVNPEYGVE